MAADPAGQPGLVPREPARGCDVSPTQELPSASCPTVMGLETRTFFFSLSDFLSQQVEGTVS